MTSDRPVVVYDCNVLLQAVLSDAGPSFACLQLVEQGSVDLIISSFVGEEIRDVLARPAILQKNPQITPERVAAFLLMLASRSRFVERIPQFFALPRDPKDEPYVNLAIAADAGYLVTWNQKHLTYLMDGTEPESIDFRAKFPGLIICTPPTFLHIIRSAQPG